MKQVKDVIRQNRRQFIITASAFGAIFSSGVLAATRSDLLPVVWQGAVLGAEASIQLYHADPKWAQQQLSLCQQEIDRLENLFSLYRPTSSICQLNKAGVLNNPDIDFVGLLSMATAFSDKSDGVFDVTVQPLWALYADHFSKSNPDPKGPAADQILKTLQKIGSENISIASDRVSFLKEGMGITLNGVAQGYITDKVTDMLRNAGFENVLVSLGEQYALGQKPDAHKWRVGILSPTDGHSKIKTIELENAAIATSGGYGSPFSSQSNLNHLIDPRVGSCAELHRSVSVIAKTAVKADMVSTALSLMSEADGTVLVATDPDVMEILYF
jgi:FAD:protein FMN transferase